MATYASESGHWYDKEGNPRYTIIGKNGNERPTTLRDARKEGYLPSVTTIIRQAASPGLQKWLIRQAVLSALTHPGLKGTDEDIDLIERDAKEQSQKAMERGTAVHGALELAFQGKEFDPLYHPIVEGVNHALYRHCGVQEWSAERSFAHEGYAGKVDLFSPEWIVDFKTKEFGPEDKLSTYDEHGMQLAAYDFGLGGKGRKAAIVYVSVTNPGLVKIIDLEPDELCKGLEMFHALLQFFQAKTGYRP